MRGTMIFILGATAVLSSFWAGAQSQAPGTIDQTFNAGAIDGAVRGIVLDADSRILIAGDFNSVGGIDRQHVARLNSDGSVDSSFVPAPELWLQPSNRVTQIAVQRDGAVLLGGRFGLVDSATGTNSTVYVVRLTRAGNLDGSFGPVTSQPLLPLPPPWSSWNSDALTATAVQADDKLIVSYNGCDNPAPNFPYPAFCGSATVLRRLTVDGQPDASFTQQTGFPPTLPPVAQICVEPSGSCVVLFGPGYPSIRRFDAQGLPRFTFGVLGNETGMGPVSPIVNAIGSAEDGSVWVAGAYAIPARQFVGLTRMGADGNWDPACLADNLFPRGLLPLPGRRVLIADGGQGGLLKRLDSRAQLDPAWHTTTFPRTNLVMAQQADGKVLVAGNFLVERHQKVVRFFCDDRTPRAPVILQSPVSQTWDSTNQPAVLFVRAEGYPYPSYQWYKNGIQLAGQTNDTVIAPVQFASYHVVVSNTLGSVTSPEAQISVRRIPTIAEALNTPDWQYSGTALGQVVTGSASHDGVAAVMLTTPPDYWNIDYYPGYLETTVSGPGILSFWIKTSGDRIFEVSDSVFEVNGVTWSRIDGSRGWQTEAYVLPAGSVRLRWWVLTLPATTSKGTLFLDEVSLTPMPPEAPRILVQPQPQVARQGGWASFQVQVQSTVPLQYQWYYSLTNSSVSPMPPTPLPGATNASLVLAPVTRWEAGAYQVIATNQLFRLVSEPAALKVDLAFDWVRAGWRPDSFLVSPNLESIVFPNYEENYYGSSLGVTVLSLRTDLRTKFNLNIPLLPMQTDNFLLAISPDGQTLAAGTLSGDIELHSLANGAKTGTLTNTSYPIASFAFAPRGRLAAAGTTNAVVGVWRTVDGALTHVLSWTNRPGPVAALAFSPDDQWLAADCGHHAVVWRLADNAGLEPDPDWDPKGWIGYSPDGALLASRTQIRDTAGWQEQYRFDSGQDEMPLAFSPDGRLLVFGTEEAARFLWIEPGPLLRLLEDYRFWGKETRLAFSSDGQRILLNSAGPWWRLTVEPATVLTTLTPFLDYGAHLLRLRVAGLANSLYTLQISPDMSHWQDWTNGVLNGTTASHDVGIGTGPSPQFYRARLE